MERLVGSEAFQCREYFDFDPIVFAWAGLDETSFLAAASALGEPEMLGHFLHEFGFDEGDGLLVLDETVEDVIVLVLFFGSVDLEAAEQAVLTAILGRDCFPLDCAGSCAFLGIGAIGRDLFGGCHKMFS